MNHLVELLIRATLLGTAGLAVWWLARNRSAESRVMILRAILAGLAILPALWALGPRWSFSVPGMAKPEPVVVDMSLDFMANASLTTEPAPGPTPVDLLPYVYFGLATLLIVPALIGRHMIERVWQRGVPLTWTAEDELCEALDSVGVKQSVEARMGALASPMVFGVWRRRLLVPLGFDEWPEEHRRLALLHEAAHLRRFDCAWQHLAHGVRAVYWCHPLVWFLSRALKDETELAADERAIRSGAEAADYASALVAIARILQEPGRLVRSQGVTFMNHRQLDRRVRSVLHGRRRGFTIPGALALAAMVISGTTIAASAAPEAPRAEILFAEQQDPTIVAQGSTAPRAVISRPVVVTQAQKAKKGKKSKKVTAQTVIISRPVKAKQGKPHAAASPMAAPVAQPAIAAQAPGVAPRATTLPAKAGSATIASPMPQTGSVSTTSPAPRAATAPAANPAVAPLPQGRPTKKGGETTVSTPFGVTTIQSRPAYSSLGGRQIKPTAFSVNLTPTVSRVFESSRLQTRSTKGVPILKDVPIIGQLFRNSDPLTQPTSRGALGGVRVGTNNPIAYGVDPAKTLFPAQVKADDAQSAEALARKAAEYAKIKEYLEKVRKEHGDSAREEALLKLLADQAKAESEHNTAQTLAYRSAVNQMLSTPAIARTTYQTPLLNWTTTRGKTDPLKSTTHWAYPTLSSGKTLELNFVGKKPVTITLIVNGKPQKVKVTPDSQGRVTVEVAHDGTVKVKSGRK
jgi:hypothetical protein